MQDQVVEWRKKVLSHSDSNETKEALAESLIVQGKTSEAETYLKHLDSNVTAESARYLYLLIEGFQQEGKHQDALRILSKIEMSIPESSYGKKHKKYEKISQKNKNSSKKIKSTLIAKGSAPQKKRKLHFFATDFSSLVFVFDLVFYRESNCFR